VDEEKILSPERHEPEGIFSGIVVCADACVVQEASKRAHVVPRVARCAPEERFRAVRPAQVASEQEQSDEERARLLAAQCEVGGRADDLAALGFVLDAVDSRDELEGLFRLGLVAGLEVLAARMGEAPAAKAFTLLFERIVASVVIAAEGTLGISECLDGSVSAA
jgi:hypothetical protein